MIIIYNVEWLWLPVPTIPEGVNYYDANNYKNGAWRWSIYAKKMIVQGLNLIGEAAFDHLRPTVPDGTTLQSESLFKKGHWHWDVKIGYFF
jgi:hypothetical protein